MAKWPTVKNDETTEQGDPPKFHCTSVTTMSCGTDLSVGCSGYNKENVKRRSILAVENNAERHLRTCRRCKTR
jgi:hypothetical protein